jgi:hypothetical protein
VQRSGNSFGAFAANMVEGKAVRWWVWWCLGGDSSAASNLSLRKAVSWWEALELAATPLAMTALLPDLRE